MDPVHPDPAIAEALQLLGKDRLLLAVHDASFPGIADADAGRGSPYGAGGEAFARFARELGFTGLQFGPQGQTSPINASPYDGTLFSRNPLSLDLKTLVDEGLLSEASWQGITACNPQPDGHQVAYGYALNTYRQALEEARGRSAHLAGELATFWCENAWLRDDALYEALSQEHGQRGWRDWPQTGEAALDAVLCAPPPGTQAQCAARRQHIEDKHRATIERHTLAQWLLLRQHRAFRARVQPLGLKIYGDVQVGFSQHDLWSCQNLLRQDYFMGAPPSRTNREGQPWSYQVLDPAQYLSADGSPGPVLNFIAGRLGKMLGEFDGLRLDHPHGLVCPWVYRADSADPYTAVQQGARLFAAPDLPDHPGLAAYSIADADQIDRSRCRYADRYADNWEIDLSPAQEARYALIVDALIAQVLAHGREPADVLCEVLSTEPLPLNRVRRRHGLGRFRVTQKADLDNTADVYRSENAAPEDWVMVGNHDTPSIWNLVEGWLGNDISRKQAEYLAWRLHLPDAHVLANDHRRLAHAKFAELFLSPARNVMVFFADLLGLKESYNMPGTVNATNWMLRVPPSFAPDYAAMRLDGSALNLHAVLALALRARPDIDRPDLITALETAAGWEIVPAVSAAPANASEMDAVDAP